jgi:hypothetical protein
MPRRKIAKTKKSVKLKGMYLCHACGKFMEREAEDGKPLKKWIKSFCLSTGKDTRLWLMLKHNMPSSARTHS